MNENQQINPKGLVLRVLNGLHAGAELALVVGEYVIGRGEDDDIILEDQEVLPKHCQLKIEPEAIIVSPLAGTVFVDGQKIEEATSLNLFQIVTLGNVCFAIGPSGEKWPELKLPVLQKETELPKDEEEKKVTVEEGLSAVKTEKEELEEREKRNPFKYLFIFFAFFVVSVALFFFFFSTKKQQALPPPKKDKFELVQSFVKKAGFPYIQILKDEKGGIQIKGYVERIKDKQILFKKLKLIDPNIKFNIYTNEESLILAQDIISQMGLKDLRLKVFANGKLLIEGVIPNKEKLNKLLNFLKEDVPGLSGIECHLICLAEIEKKIKQLFLDKNIPNLQIMLKPSAIVISGKLAKDKKGELEKIVAMIKRKYGDKFQIIKNVQFVQENIKLDLKAVYMGAINYIVLKDGRRFFEGSTLPGGYLLKKITPQRLVLEKNGENCYYFY